MQWHVHWRCTPRLLLLSPTYWSTREMWYHRGGCSPDHPQQGSLTLPCILPAHLLAPVLWRVLSWALGSGHMLELLMSDHPQLQLPSPEQRLAKQRLAPPFSPELFTHAFNTSLQPGSRYNPYHAHPAPTYSQPMCYYLFPLFPSSCFCAQNDLCFLNSHSQLFFPFTIFNWSKVDLQCCVSFMGTAKRSSHTYIWLNIYMYIYESESVSHSIVSDSVAPWTVAHHAPLSMAFSRQEYWNGMPCPSPGDLPDPGIEPWSPALQADSVPSEPPGEPIYLYIFLFRFFSRIDYYKIQFI